MSMEYIDPRVFMRDAFTLARKIHDSGFRPDLMVIPWRGGAPVGIVLDEFFRWKGLSCVSVIIKISSYSGIDAGGEAVIEDIGGLVASVKPGMKVLVVDDIFDSGRSCAAIKGAIPAVAGEVRIAALYHRTGRAMVPLRPDYIVRSTGSWVVFPHELAGLSKDEILAKDDCMRDCLF